MTHTQHRTFAHAAVRKLALLLVAVALAYVGTGRVEAGQLGCDLNAPCPRDEAYSLAYQHATQFAPTIGDGTVAQPLVVDYQSYYEACATAGGTTCTWRIGSSSDRTAFYHYTACSAGTVWNEATKTCAADCAAKEPFTSGFTPPNGSIGCSSDGCTVGYFYNGDGTSTQLPTGQQCDVDIDEQQRQCAFTEGYYWHPTLNVCAPVDPPDCAPGQAPKEGVCKKPDQCPDGMIEDANGLCKPKDNECPAGNVKSPLGECLPGDGQCAAGEARGADGTCKKDDNGDGQPDADDPNNKSFSGGDNCNAPPSCSGDPIACGQARIQWRIDCNTRRNVNITGGSCDAVPVCTGEKCDALEYSQLLQQWRATCALEKLAGQGNETPGNGDANGNGIPDELEQPIAEIPGETPSVGESADLWGQVQQNGWLAGGACPGLPAFSVGGNSVDLGQLPCEQGEFLGWAIYLFFLTAAGFVIGRAASGT